LLRPQGLRVTPARRAVCLSLQPSIKKVLYAWSVLTAKSYDAALRA